MNILAREKQIRVMTALWEGNSERAVERMTDVNRLTISRLALRLGEGASRLHDRIVRDLTCADLMADEQWSYIHTKKKRVRETDPAEYGDMYTYMVLDRPSRLIIAWLVGKRNDETTAAFMADLRSRLLVMPAITTDGFRSYIAAVGEQFPGCDYAQTIKNYNKRDDEPFINKEAVFGTPDLTRASTAYAERNNGTMRHFIGRMRRKCYAFSKKIENHRAAAALAYARYNFCYLVKTLRSTPAMAAGLTDHIWEPEEFFEAVMNEPLGQKPVAKPLVPNELPRTTHRELPDGRGFLRVVPSGASAAQDARTERAGDSEGTASDDEPA